MPRPRKKERIRCPYFVWLLGRRNGIFFADGRSNRTKLGRHSLGTRDQQEALKQLTRLDALQAVEQGLVARSILETTPADQLYLAEGQRLYLEHVGRTRVMGGATDPTVDRYRSVFKKFNAFAQREGITDWHAAANKRTLGRYGTWLEAEEYDYATQYLELTTLKQTIKWLVQEGKLSASSLVALRLRKPQGTTTYCYTRAEVQAIIDHCSESADLHWLRDVVVALATTGLRISELADLLWSDIDLDANVLRLCDTSRQGSKAERSEARTTKNHRDRVLPIHPDLRRILQRLGRTQNGQVFRGPNGGELKSHTVRYTLVRQVLMPLDPRFPAAQKSKGFVDGRLHSLRHYFCSMSANSGVPEQVVMAWLGHQDSRMVRRYYHLHQEEAQRQMSKINFVGSERKNKKARRHENNGGADSGKN